MNGGQRLEALPGFRGPLGTDGAWVIDFVSGGPGSYGVAWCEVRGARSVPAPLSLQPLTTPWQRRAVAYLIAAIIALAIAARITLALVIGWSR